MGGHELEGGSGPNRVKLLGVVRDRTKGRVGPYTVDTHSGDNGHLSTCGAPDMEGHCLREEAISTEDSTPLPPRLIAIIVASP